jgi:alpha/beta superfamily hydrolase
MNSGACAGYPLARQMRDDPEGRCDMGGIEATSVRFSSAGRPACLLEGIITRPQDDAPDALHAGVVLCHPQPASCTMDDGLVSLLASELAERGLITLRFNFRGVGSSEGQQTDGRLEPLDIAGAVNFLVQQEGINHDRVALIGHAFGAFMALTYALHDTRIGLVVTVSPPVFRVAPGLGEFDRPKLFITGEFDEVAPRHKLEPWIERLPNRALLVVSGARHLMRGYEDVAANTIVKYVARWAVAPGL